MPSNHNEEMCGRIAYLTDDAGQVTQTLNYLPYGEDWVDVQNYAETQYPRLGIYRFNGKEKDYESGFHYYGARYYWSETLTGWLSVDPMMDKYPSVSPYNYRMWSPILFIDPDGEEKLIFFHTQKPSVYSFTGQKNAAFLFDKAKKQWETNVHLKNYANKYKDHEGVIHLFAHGNPKYINLAEKGKNRAKGLELFLLNSSETYKKNMEDGKTSLVLLHSCQTGKGENSIGQELSVVGDFLVIAPSDNVSMGSDEHVENNGTWNVFYKEELVGRYSGNIDFQTQLDGKDAQEVIRYWKNKYDEKHNQSKND